MVNGGTLARERRLTAAGLRWRLGRHRTHTAGVRDTQTESHNTKTQHIKLFITFPLLDPTRLTARNVTQHYEHHDGVHTIISQQHSPSYVVSSYLQFGEVLVRTCSLVRSWSVM